MRQYLLTRSAFGPEWDLDANRRRLEMTRAVTARLAARQTLADWTWIVLLDERDPLLAERLALYEASAPAFCPLVWRPPIEPKRDDPLRRQRAACADYRAPWRSLVGPADDIVLMTRLDDDDGLAPDALARYRRAARRVKARTVLMLPRGVRVWDHRWALAYHARNAMHTLVTMPGDDACVYDYSHIKAASAAPITLIDNQWGWLWVRHRDTISGVRRATWPITPKVRHYFPADWRALERAWG